MYFTVQFPFIRSATELSLSAVCVRALFVRIFIFGIGFFSLSSFTSNKRINTHFVRSVARFLWAHSLALHFRCFLIDAVSSTGNWLTEQRAINKSKISHFIVVVFCFVYYSLPISLPLALACSLSSLSCSKYASSFMRSAFSFLFSIVLITMR